MKFIQIGIIVFLASALATPCHAQRDANTASARAAYSKPSSPGYKQKGKRKKAKAKKNKSKKDNEGVRMRRRSFGI